jgi:hypothetical protein
VAPGQLRQLLDRGDVAVHREDAVGDDERAAPLRLPQAPGEVLEVRVPVDEDLGPGEPAAVDDAGVVQLVGEDDLPAAGQRRDHSGVGQKARAVEESRLVALEGRDPLLEAPVRLHVAADQPRRTGADAPAHGRLGRRLAHPRMVGEAEVVVRAEQQHGPPVEQHVGALRAADQPQSPGEAAVAKLLEAVGDVGHGAGRPRLMPPSRWGRAAVSSPS